VSVDGDVVPNSCCYCSKLVGAEGIAVSWPLMSWAHPFCWWRARTLELEDRMDRLMEHNPVYVARGQSLRLAEAEVERLRRRLDQVAALADPDSAEPHSLLGRVRDLASSPV
jgi:hypothetical protein